MRSAASSPRYGAVRTASVPYRKLRAQQDLAAKWFQTRGSTRGRPVVQSLGGVIENVQASAASGPGGPSVSQELSRFFDRAPAVSEDAERLPIAAAGPGVERGAKRRSSGLAPPKIKRAYPKRPIESIVKLRVGTYNILNLMRHVGRFLRDDEGNFRRDARGKLIPAPGHGPIDKDEEKIKESARAILESDPDILALQEVEDIEILRYFVENYLEDKYDFFLIEGNDSRKIDIGFIVKKDLPFDLEYRTNKAEMWTDPVTKRRQRLFSRDLPVMIVRQPGRKDPLFAVLGTHYKSMGDRPADPKSNRLRTAQVERTTEIIERLRSEFGAELPIMMTGDFNDNVGPHSTTAMLFSRSGLKDAFDRFNGTEKEIKKEDRTTFVFFQKSPDGRLQRILNQLDAVLTNGFLHDLISAVYVYRYRSGPKPTDPPKPIPSTPEEVAANPSDHFPVVTELEFQPVVRRPPSAKPAKPTSTAAAAAAGGPAREKESARSRKGSRKGWRAPRRERFGSRR